MRVSAIIPNFNKEKTLRACLTAVYAQTHPLAQVILVDDASTDSSRRIAAEFPCQLLELPVNRGVSAARNAGAALADGDVLFFLDSDIALAADAVGNAVRTLRDHPACGVVQGIYAAEPLFADGRVEEYKTLAEHFRRRRDAGVTSSTLFALTAVPRRVFETVGGFDESLRDAEDVELGTRLPPTCEIRVAADVVGRHDDVDRLGPYLGELFRRARTYAATVVTARRRHAVPGDGARATRGVDIAAIVAMSSCALAVVSLPLGVVSSWLLGVPLALVAVSLVVDRGLLGFVRRHRGPAFAVFVAAMQFLTHVTEFAGMALGAIRGAVRPPGTVE